MTYSELAQNAIDRIVSTVRERGDLNEALDGALSDLVIGLKADRGLIWRVVGDQLTVTQCHTADLPELVGAALSVEQSTAVVLTFLSMGGVGTIARDTANLQGFEPLAPFSDGTSSNLLVPLHTKGIFTGFIHLQAVQNRKWSETETFTLEKVGGILSILIGNSSELAKASMDAMELKATLEISHAFGEMEFSQALVRAGHIVSQHLKFKQFRIYLTNDQKLVDLLDETAIVDLNDAKNPYVACYKNKRSRVIQAEGTSDSTGLVLPLVPNGEAVGVLVLLEREIKITAQVREPALTLAGEISRGVSRHL